jgi:hypothetical protein
MQRWKPLCRWGRIGASLGRSSEGFDKQGDGVMKIIILVTTAFFAVLSMAAFLAVLSTAGLFVVLRAAAADLPRKDAPPRSRLQSVSIRNTHSSS